MTDPDPDDSPDAVVHPDTPVRATADVGGVVHLVDTEAPVDEVNDEPDTTTTFVYESMPVWFDRWLSITLARRLSGTAGRGRVLCPQWWRHDEVVGRLKDLWLAWEGAKASSEPGAGSAWWIHDADPMLRVILDAELGPMYLCSRDSHVDTRPLRATLTAPPPGWFDGLE